MIFETGETHIIVEEKDLTKYPSWCNHMISQLNMEEKKCECIKECVKPLVCSVVLCAIVALGYQAHFVLTLIALCNNAYRTF